MRSGKKVLGLLGLLVLTLILVMPKTEVSAATVKLNKKKATTYVGYTVQLKLKGATGTTTWSSSNKKVATVSKKGLVTGKKAGKATITVENNGNKYTCNITVKKCSEGLEFWKDGEGYKVGGIGTCKDTKIVIPATYDSKKVTGIAGSAFNGSDIISVTMPNSVTHIDTYAFANCYSLKTVTLSNNIERIESQAFWCCIELELEKLPKKLTYIGQCAFSACVKIPKMTIPDKVTDIEACAFYGCAGMKEITIPESVTNFGELYIDDNDNKRESDDVATMFEKCDSLKTIYVKKGSHVDELGLDSIFSVKVKYYK